jgi:hypothetical protein
VLQASLRLLQASSDLKEELLSIPFIIKEFERGGDEIFGNQITFYAQRYHKPNFVQFMG